MDNDAEITTLLKTMKYGPPLRHIHSIITIASTTPHLRDSHPYVVAESLKYDIVHGQKYYKRLKIVIHYECEVKSTIKRHI